MASTNKTTNYELSQYIGTDKPTYLSDYNGDMLKIDTAIKTNADNISTAVSSIESVTVVANQANTTANTANTNATSAVNTAGEANTTATNAQSTANSALATATTAQSTANTNATKIGDLSELDTEVKTDLVSAINELITTEADSTSEIKTDRTWLDGKPIYKKTVYVASLPNATSRDIPHNVSNADTIWIDTVNSFIRWANGTTSPFNYLGGHSNDTTLHNSIEVRLVDSTKFTIDTYGVDRSALSAYVTLLYTKTTDSSAS